jgi:putative membrane protein
VSTRVLAIELAVLAVAYGWAIQRITGALRPHAAWFFGGVVALATALVSPLHGVAEHSLAGHMVQHVILISVAAPLLAAGQPLTVLAAAIGWRPPRPASWPWLAAVAVVQVGALLAWHTPTLFDAAVRQPVLHEVEHATLVVTAFALWDALFRVRPAERGGAVIALFVAGLPAMAYGFALTVAHHPWYAAYLTGNDLTDQQLAGVVMWAYGGLAAVIGGVALGVNWLRAIERVSPGLPAAPTRSAP